MNERSGQPSQWSPRRKLHRLPRDQYHGRILLAVTACERDRQPLLADVEIHEAFRGHLERAATKHACLVPIYCIMPDHMHLLIQGTHEHSDALQTSEYFKLLSAKWFARKRPQLHWQESFHDHIVRAGEKWESQAKYIASNPARKDLVEGTDKWPFMGSIGYELEDVLDDAFEL